MNYTVVYLHTWTIRGWLKKNRYVLRNFPLDHIVDGVIGLPINIYSVIFLKSVNLKNIMVGRLDDDMIVSPSDGAMFILID